MRVKRIDTTVVTSEVVESSKIIQVILVCALALVCVGGFYNSLLNSRELLSVVRYTILVLSPLPTLV